MSPVQRRMTVFLVAWGLAAVTTWELVAPQDTLVGARAPQPRLQNYKQLQIPMLDAARDLLVGTSIWGVQRNGEPIPPPKPAQAVEAKEAIVWKAVGTVVRKKERYLLVQVDKTPPLAVKEGDELPDGSKLLKVTPSAYTTQGADGKKEAVQTNL